MQALPPPAGRAVRALRIYEGTTEIQYLTIARELLRGVRGGEAT